jgi:hypothetical protein
MQNSTPPWERIHDGTEAALPEGRPKTTFLPQLIRLQTALNDQKLWEPGEMNHATTLLRDLETLTLTANADDIKFIQELRTMLPHFRNTWMTLERQDVEETNGTQLDRTNALTILRQLVPTLESIAQCDFAPEQTLPLSGMQRQFEEWATQHDANKAAAEKPATTRPLSLSTGHSSLKLVIGQGRPRGNRIDAMLRHL